MKKAIIIFFNRNGITRIYNWETLTNTKFSPFLKNDKTFVYANNTFSSLSKVLLNEDKKIYLVNDAISEDEFSTFKNGGNIQLYLLTHTNPTWQSQKFGKVANGKHEPINNPISKFYPDVYDILQDTDENKFDRIFKKVFREELDAFVKYHKLLGLLPLKIKDIDWNEAKLTEEISKIKEDKLINDYKDNIGEIKINLKGTKNEFLAQLDILIDKIKKAFK